MRRYISVILTALIVCSILVTSAFAYPEAENYIYDGGLFLDEATRASVQEVCSQLYESKGIRLAVCTVDSTEGETDADFAAGVFTQWNIGNGVLLLLVRDTNSYYAVQNNNLLNYLSNEKVLEILDTGLATAFANEDYAAGALATLKSFSAYLSEKVTDGFTEEKSTGLHPVLSVIIKVVLILALLAVAGYIALVIVERRQAQKRREYLEYRRRMAREGRMLSPPPRQGNRRRQGGQRPVGSYSNIDPRRAPQGQRNTGGYPQRNSPRPNNSPQPGRPSAPRDMYRDQRTQQIPRVSQIPTTHPRSTDVSRAATVQINTADIRAAMKKLPQNGRKPDGR